MIILYFWLHSGYILAIFLATHSDYILATFLLHSDLKPIKLRILVSSWFHIKSSGKEKGGYKSLFVESEPRISFCFSTNIPCPGQHLPLSAISSLIRRVCALRSGIGFPQYLERKSFGINIDFLSWATNKLSAIRPFRYKSTWYSLWSSLLRIMKNSTAFTNCCTFPIVAFIQRQYCFFWWDQRATLSGGLKIRSRGKTKICDF